MNVIFRTATPKKSRKLRFLDDTPGCFYDHISKGFYIVLKLNAIQFQDNLHGRMRGSFVGIVKAVADGNIAGVTGGKIINVTDKAISKAVFDPANYGFNRSLARSLCPVTRASLSLVHVWRRLAQP